MSEKLPDLGDYVREAVMEWCRANGGFPIAFVAAVDVVSNEGRGHLVVTEMDDQPTHRSMGLSTYLDARYRDDAQVAFAAIMGDLEDGD